MSSAKRKLDALAQGMAAARPSSASGPSEPSAESQALTSSALPTVAAPAISPTTSPAATPQSKTMAPNTPSPITAELLSKRRRVGVLESTTANNLGTTTVSNVTLRKSSGTPTKEVKREPPRYCPGDRDELIRRLGTFQDLTQWTPKPDRVNEIEWAKQGWVCHSKERVRCTLCSKELVVKTDKTDAGGKEVSVAIDSDVQNALVDRFVNLIVDGHQEDCLWRKRGCDDTLLRLGLAHADSALASLRQRYDELCARQAFLPYSFNLRLPASFDLKSAKAQLPPTFFTEPPPKESLPAKAADVALALAMMGWQGLVNPRIGPVPNSASCATCLRRLGLWMFKSKEVNEETGEILVPAPMDHLDPIREHRFFCPWRNAAVQRNPGSKTTESRAAWEILAQTLKNNAFLRDKGNQSAKRFILHRPTSSMPGTPSRGGKDNTGEGESQLRPLGPGMVDDDEEEDTATRDAKDKERWARLRRVKSLFETKSAKKLRRTLSRPGTASSRPGTATSRPGTAAAEDESPSKSKS